MHPHIMQTLAAERIKGWQQQAAQARRVKEARRARRAWMMPLTARLVLLRSRRILSAQPVTSRHGVAEGRPVAAEGRPVAAEERRPESARAA